MTHSFDRNRSATFTTNKESCLHNRLQQAAAVKVSHQPLVVPDRLPPISLYPYRQSFLLAIMTHPFDRINPATTTTHSLTHTHDCFPHDEKSELSDSLTSFLFWLAINYITHSIPAFEKSVLFRCSVNSFHSAWNQKTCTFTRKKRAKWKKPSTRILSIPSVRMTFDAQIIILFKRWRELRTSSFFPFRWRHLQSDVQPIRYYRLCALSLSLDGVTFSRLFQRRNGKKRDGATESNIGRRSESNFESSLCVEEVCTADPERSSL